MSSMKIQRSPKTSSVAASMLAFVAVSAGACSDSSVPSEGGRSVTSDVDSGAMLSCPDTTDGIQEQILVPTCGVSGCHDDSESPAGQLDFVSPGLQGRIVEAVAADCTDRIVAPGEPQFSLLYKKVRFDDPGCGERMPLDLDPLSESTIECLERWIENVSPLSELPEGGSGGRGIDSGMPPVVGDAGSTEGGPPENPCGEGEILCGSTCIADIAPELGELHDRVLFKSCAASRSCHTGSNPKEQLSLVTPEDVLAMNNQPSVQRPELDLIEPGKPEESYLINKLRGEDMAEKSGTGLTAQQMPRMANPLCEPIIERIEEWIRNGATGG